MGFITTFHMYIKYFECLQTPVVLSYFPFYCPLLLLPTHPSLIYISIISFSSLIIIICMHICKYINTTCRVHVVVFMCLGQTM